MPRKPPLPDEDHLVQRYLAGESTGHIAKGLGVSQYRVWRLMSDRGVIRSHKESCHVRWARPSERRKTSRANLRVWARRSPGERRDQVRAANQAARGSKASFETLCKRAKSREGRMDASSSLEPYFYDLMSERGVRFDQVQTAIGPYNVDFTVGPVAVEVARPIRRQTIPRPIPGPYETRPRLGTFPAVLHVLRHPLAPDP